MPAATQSPIAACLSLSQAISRARSLDDIYAVALDALAQGLGISRASILLFDADRVMRFKATRGLSETYRRAVEGHTPWTLDSTDPQPIVVGDVTREPSLEEFLPAIADERLAAMTFIPLVSAGQVIGKFMLYYEAPYAPAEDELQLASLIAGQVAFAIERTQSEQAAHRSEERLRFALDAASMGTWDWDLATHTIRWSENIERLHSLPQGTFDGTFSSYEHEIHPDDRNRVLESARRAIDDGVPYDVEYRIVAPDGSLRWVEGKGRVEHESGKPRRMTGVCMVVTHRKEAELAKLGAAEEANRLKDQFLATLSHELRTPLNAIIGWVQMLRGDTLPPERARQAIDVIGRNAKLQAQLIEDILDVSRIITGKLDVERRALLVPQLVDTVVSGIVPTAAQKHIEITKEIPEELPAIDGDPKRLQQVLGNVLSNAIKFTPERGRIGVRCAAVGGSISIEVRDSGPGIDPDLLPFIFDRFRQGDSQSTRQHGGLGLGLAIARHIVEQHGGQITAQSGGAMQGTTVDIRIPIGTAQPPASDALRIAGPLRLDLTGVKVLVVDDQQDSRELLTAIFERCSADMIQCESAQSAWEVLASTSVGLIVADIAMPGIDGYELIERVRGLGGDHANVPAVAVSAFARLEDRKRAFAAGYHGYCAKPLDTSEFLGVVDDVLLRASQQPARRTRRTY